jgi:predicted ATPase
MWYARHDAQRFLCTDRSHECPGIAHGPACARDLLILDNCEHVIGEAAGIADALLGGCPQLRILATSREPLRIDGELT